MLCFIFHAGDSSDQPELALICCKVVQTTKPFGEDSFTFVFWALSTDRLSA